MRRGFSGVTRGILCAVGRRGVATGVIAIAGACSDSNSTTSTPVATSIAANSATDQQTGVAGTALAQPVSVVVKDQSGAVMENAAVSWTVVSGGGTVASASSATDATGTATVVWTLGPVAGPDSLKASIATGASVTFSATATAGSASAMRIMSGNPQSVAAGAQTAPMVVQVVDQFANPVANATVTWAVSGGGTLSAATTTTDATGTTQVTLSTDPAAATYFVTAATGTISPITFTITSM
jgi:Bacterial Ig-like domain (group 1)